MRVIANGFEYEVFWRHKRITPVSQELPSAQSTCVILKHTTKEEVGNGRANCSQSDNFSYNKGRKVSLARALGRFPKEQRAQFWAAYNRMRGGKW